MRYINYLALYMIFFTAFVFLIAYMEEKRQKNAHTNWRAKLQIPIKFDIGHELLFNETTKEYSLIAHDSFYDAEYELKGLAEQGWKVLATVEGYKAL